MDLTGFPARRALTSALGCTAVIGTLLAAHPAAAQTIRELRAQVNALQRRLDQMEAAQARPQRQAAAIPPAEATRQPLPAPIAQRRARPSEPRPALPREEDDPAPHVTSALPVQAQRGDASEGWRGSFPGSFRIPGTGTSVRLYGFVKLNMSGDLGPRYRADAISGQSIPLGRGAAGARSDGDFQANARRSRLGIETRTPFGEAFGEVRTQVEIDFAGQNTDLTTQGTSNSHTPRLRQAFAEFGQFGEDGWGTVLVGQSNSLFAETPLVPLQWLDDWTPLGLSNVRQAQLRYSRRLEGGITLKAALENAYSDITSTTGTSYPDANGGAGFGINQVPDLTAQGILEGDWGFVALRGLLRQVRIENNGAASPAARYSDSALGYGIGATGALHLLNKRLILTGSVNYGQGIGRYLDSSSAGFGAVTAFGLPGIGAGGRNIDTVGVLAGFVGVQYHLTETVRTNASLYGVRLDYPGYVRAFSGCAGAGSGSTCDGVNREIWAGVVNLIWSPVRPIDLGIEYSHVERTLENRNASGARGGRADRIQASAIVRF